MSTMIKFTSSKLNTKRKEGILKPDETGSYELVIGGLNTFNSINEFYTGDGVKHLFESSSSLMRRIQKGSLKGELGHPRKLPGMNDNDYIRRILDIDEKNVCCFFKEIWIDERFGRDNPEYNNQALMAIKAKVKPSGPKADALIRSLEDKDQNVHFSIRAFTKDFYQRGQCIRVLDQIVTWDYVNEGGISIANKWDTPALESFEDMIISLRNLEDIEKSYTTNTIATEDSKLIVHELIENYSNTKVKPKYSHW